MIIGRKSRTTILIIQEVSSRINSAVLPENQSTLKPLLTSRSLSNQSLAVQREGSHSDNKKKRNTKKSIQLKTSSLRKNHYSDCSKKQCTKANPWVHSNHQPDMHLILISSIANIITLKGWRQRVQNSSCLGIIARGFRRSIYITMDRKWSRKWTTSARNWSKSGLK